MSDRVSIGSSRSELSDVSMPVFPESAQASAEAVSGEKVLAAPVKTASEDSPTEQPVTTETDDQGGTSGVTGADGQKELGETTEEPGSEDPTPAADGLSDTADDATEMYTDTGTQPPGSMHGSRPATEAAAEESRPLTGADGERPDTDPSSANHRVSGSTPADMAQQAGSSARGDDSEMAEVGQQDDVKGEAEEGIVAEEDGVTELEQEAPTENDGGAPREPTKDGEEGEVYASGRFIGESGEQEVHGRRHTGLPGAGDPPMSSQSSRPSTASEAVSALNAIFEHDWKSYRVGDESALAKQKLADRMAKKAEGIPSDIVEEGVQGWNEQEQDQSSVGARSPRGSQSPRVGGAEPTTGVIIEPVAAEGSISGFQRARHGPDEVGSGVVGSAFITEAPVKMPETEDGDDADAEMEREIKAMEKRVTNPRKKKWAKAYAPLGRPKQQSFRAKKQEFLERVSKLTGDQPPQKANLIEEVSSPRIKLFTLKDIPEDKVENADALKQSAPQKRMKRRATRQSSLNTVSLSTPLADKVAEPVMNADIKPHLVTVPSIFLARLESGNRDLDLFDVPHSWPRGHEKKPNGDLAPVKLERKFHKNESFLPSVPPASKMPQSQQKTASYPVRPDHKGAGSMQFSKEDDMWHEILFPPNPQAVDRSNVRQLEQWLNANLQRCGSTVQQRVKNVDEVERIYDLCFHEVYRSICTNNKERADLLMRMWTEGREIIRDTVAAKFDLGYEKISQRFEDYVRSLRHHAMVTVTSYEKQLAEAQEVIKERDKMIEYLHDVTEMNKETIKRLEATDKEVDKSKAEVMAIDSELTACRIEKYEIMRRVEEVEADARRATEEVKNHYEWLMGKEVANRRLAEAAKQKKLHENEMLTRRLETAIQKLQEVAERESAREFRDFQTQTEGESRVYRQYADSSDEEIDGESKKKNKEVSFNTKSIPKDLLSALTVKKVPEELQERSMRQNMVFKTINGIYSRRLWKKEPGETLNQTVYKYFTEKYKDDTKQGERVLVHFFSSVERVVAIHPKCRLFARLTGMEVASQRFYANDTDVFMRILAFVLKPSSPIEHIEGREHESMINVAHLDELIRRVFDGKESAMKALRKRTRGFAQKKLKDDLWVYDMDQVLEAVMDEYVNLQMANIMESYDINNDGTLSEVEFTNILRQWHPERSIKEFQEMFDKVVSEHNTEEMTVQIFTHTIRIFNLVPDSLVQGSLKDLQMVDDGQKQQAASDSSEEDEAVPDQFRKQFAKAQEWGAKMGF